MRVAGVDALKLTKSKAVLIVKFLSPQSLRDTNVQMNCTSLEPKRGLGQGADLSVLTAIKHTLPHTKSLHDIAVRQLSASGVTRAMIADLNSLHAGLIFDASHVTPGDNKTSEQSPTTSDFKIRSAQDPIGYTNATPDPKHHGQAMCSSMRTEWIKSQNLEMQRFVVVAYFKRFCAPPSVLKIKFSAPAFTIKLRERGANLTNVKCDSWYRVST